MTAFARLAPPLRRLFTRIDEAEASDTTLRIAHAYWSMKRNAHVLPRLNEINLQELIACKSRLFLFEKRDEGEDWTLRFAGDRIRDEFTSRDGWPRLSSLANRRHAARLRRLFQSIEDRAMAVTATFSDHGRIVELFAAPLATHNQKVGAIFGGMALTATACPLTSPDPWRRQHRGAA